MAEVVVHAFEVVDVDQGGPQVLRVVGVDGRGGVEGGLSGAAVEDAGQGVGGGEGLEGFVADAFAVDGQAVLGEVPDDGEGEGCQDDAGNVGLAAGEGGGDEQGVPGGDEQGGGADGEPRE
ncbi:hypothetical protein GCM10017784_20570 [Deinococcus indicus]|nr:hypothetical protein GCM10017784_20570 [Deinococcus indicus]